MLEFLPTSIANRLSATPTSKQVWSNEHVDDGLLSPNNSPRFRRGHRRQLSLSSLRSRKLLCSVTVLLILIFLGSAFAPVSVDQLPVPYRDGDLTEDAPGTGNTNHDDGGIVPLGQSKERNGREFFWWEQFPSLHGLYRGRKHIVPYFDYVPEQRSDAPDPTDPIPVPEVNLVETTSPLREDFRPCYIDEEHEILPPRISAYEGLPQGLSEPLFGSQKELGFNNQVCYDRVNRFAPYGYGFAEEEGGLGISSEGDDEGLENVTSLDWRTVKWHNAQQQCLKTNAEQLQARTAFVIRTWSTFNYSQYHIMMLRAIISELVLASGGQYTIHFLIHVQDDSLPIWASKEVYDQVLKDSLPEEFRGMGTLWSVAQMKLIYPPPFPESVVNFSGGDVYEAYRSLHFPFQYFATQHPEFDYFWHWEMDIRVTGHYHELLHQISTWADRQPREYAWERSANFFLPRLYNDSYEVYAQSVVEETDLFGRKPITEPQLPQKKLFDIPSQSPPSNADEITDLITFNPLFDPEKTRWAFHDDITGYNIGKDGKGRPPTRASLITTSRLSRRLLLLMHEETYRNKHTMFPEMYPASIALHYGLKAVYAPLPVYLDLDWPTVHANEVFNNAPLGKEGKAAGMDHGKGHFHGEGGSVFGPGEHVFRGATYYSNAWYAGYLWRRWLGREKNNDEIAWELGAGGGRMCLPMMVLHPIKHE